MPAPVPSNEDWRLAALINASPAQFEAAFDRARPAPDAGTEPIAFAALSGGSNVATAERIARAITHVRTEGWLHRLIEQIVTAREIPGAAALLEEAHAQSAIQAGSTLQQLLDASRGFAGAGIEFQGLAHAIRQVCRIDIDGRAKGTGFLVRPDIVLTAYHVIRPLTEHDPDELDRDPAVPVQPLLGSANRLQIVFDDIDILAGGHRQRLPGFAVAVADDWLAGASPCHRLELRRNLPNDIGELADKFDYALIRLRGIARIGIPPARIRDRPPVTVGTNIAILQHPDGRAMAVDQSQVVALRGDWRFEHQVNAQGGSSGSPCFDREFNVVGLHQAGGGGVNRAVPLAMVRPLIDLLPPPDPRLTPMCELTEGVPGYPEGVPGDPVIGRLETQRWTWDQLEAERGEGRSHPILVVRGTQRSGKSFTVAILRSLLPREQHDVVRLGAREDVQALLPEAFAQRLLERLGYPPMPVGVDDPNTERTRSWKQAHLPAFIQALDAGRAGRGVWIAIDDIDQAAIGSSTEISDYLFALYAEAARRAWLRFILLGLPSVPEPIRDIAERHDLTLPTEEDISNYLFAKLPTSIPYDERKGIVGSTLVHLAEEDQIKRLQRKLVRVVEYYARARP